MLPQFTPCVALLVLLASSLVSAAPKATTVQAAVTGAGVPGLYWEAPAACPSEAEFRRRVTEYLGRELPATATFSTATATVKQNGRTFDVKLTVEDPGQRRVRTLTTMSCAEALDATALIVALAIDPTIIARLPGTRKSSNNGSPNPTAGTDMSLNGGGFLAQPKIDEACPACPVIPMPIPCARDATARQTILQLRGKVTPLGDPASPRLGLHLSSELAYRQLPGVAFGAGLGAAMEWPRLRLSLDVGTSRGTRSNQVKGGDFRWAAGSIAACVLSGSRLSFGPCTALRVGGIWGVGFGVDVPERATRLWVSSSFGGAIRYLHGDTTMLAFYANAELPWWRPVFDLAGEPLYKPPAVGYLAGLQVGLLLR